MNVGQGNEGSAQAWDGGEGMLWAAHSEFYDASVRLYQERLIETASIKQGDRVLDVGCGNGETTRASARRAASAVGIDLSSPMIEQARKLASAEGLANATFVQGDAQVHSFAPQSFDIAVSRSGAMFFADQVAAFTNIARAVAPGGRLAILSWQGNKANEWLRTFVAAVTLGAGSAPPDGVPGPFAHADPKKTAEILTSAGFSDVAFDSVEFPMYFGKDAAEGYSVMSQQLAWLMRDLDADDHLRAHEALRATLLEHETPEGVAYGSAAWMITARRA